MCTPRRGQQRFPLAPAKRRRHGPGASGAPSLSTVGTVRRRQRRVATPRPRARRGAHAFAATATRAHLCGEGGKKRRAGAVSCRTHLRPVRDVFDPRRTRRIGWELRYVIVLLEQHSTMVAGVLGTNWRPFLHLMTHAVIIAHFCVCDGNSKYITPYCICFVCVCAPEGYDMTPASFRPVRIQKRCDRASGQVYF